VVTAWWVIALVVMAGGAAVTLQAQLAAIVEDRLGTLEAIFLTYGIGGLLSGLLVLLARGGNLPRWRELPPVVLLAGVFGVVIVGAISFAVARLGVVRGLLLITVAQFAVAAVVDHFGLLGAEVQRFTLQTGAGVALLLGGAWLVLR
jgi:transporter family-2 protein